jgi:hypothetical protein
MAGISVISYLSYLHEVSRKILQRGGFENVLHGKTKRQNPCYFDFDRPAVQRPAYLRSISVLLNEQPGKGLFLGLGLITGQLEGDRRRRNLSAPLFFCGVEVESEEGNPSRADYEVLWDSITLNYDLMTLFLEREAPDAEDAFQNAFAFDNRVSTEKLKVLSDVERELDRNVDSPEYQAGLKQGPKLRELMKLLRDNIPELGGISLCHDLYEHTNLAAYVARRTPTFFSHRFFFVAPVADQLSTSVALHKLIRQVEEDGLRE